MYENFKYLDAVAQKEITNGVFSGSVLSVIHKGETVYLKSFGLADKEKNIPMKTDSIFRLFSMSKPVTATRRVRTAHQQRKRLSKSTMTTILIFLQSPTMAQRITAGTILRQTRLLKSQ